jgi:hypothetical protein
MSETDWRDKAHKVIGEYSLAAYRQANILPNGRKRRQHVPYHIPEIASSLIAALGADDEVEAKRLFHVEAIGAWTMI